MENKFKNCKVCGNEVAKSAKVCPKCGAKLKKRNPVLIGIIVIIIIAIIGASGTSEEPKKVDKTMTTQSTLQNTENNMMLNSEDISKEDKSQTYIEETTFKVGETVELRGVSTTLVAVEEKNGSNYNFPADGNVFLLCEFNITNNSDSDVAVSSMISFEAYCDDYTCQYSLGAILEAGDRNQLDGTVAPGKKINGVVGYEVPEDWEELEIYFKPNVGSDKEIVFVARNDK